MPIHTERCCLLLHPGLAGSRSVADQCMHASLTLKLLTLQIMGNQALTLYVSRISNDFFAAAVPTAPPSTSEEWQARAQAAAQGRPRCAASCAGPVSCEQKRHSQAAGSAGSSPMVTQVCCCSTCMTAIICRLSVGLLPAKLDFGWMGVLYLGLSDAAVLRRNQVCWLVWSTYLEYTADCQAGCSSTRVAVIQPPCASCLSLRLSLVCSKPLRRLCCCMSFWCATVQAWRPLSMSL